MKTNSIRRALGSLAATILALIQVAAFFSSCARADITVLVSDQQGQAVPSATIEVLDRENNGAYQHIVDQKDRRYVPFVSAVPVGTTIKFPNSDATRHHVYSFSEAKQFELKLYSGDDADPVLFDKAGLVSLGCNVHDHMRAYVLVTDRLSGVSDDRGAVVFKGLDELTSLRVWHWQLKQPLEIEPEPEGASSGFYSVVLPFTFDPVDPQKPKSNGLRSRLKKSE